MLPAVSDATKSEHCSTYAMDSTGHCHHCLIPGRDICWISSLNGHSQQHQDIAESLALSTV